MGGVDAEIDAGARRRKRQCGMEMEMRSPCFVHEQRLIGGVNEAHDRLEVGSDSVIRRRHEVDRGDVGMIAKRLRDGFGRHAVVHPQLFVDLGMHIDGLRAAHNQSAEHRLVRVAGHGDLLTWVHRRHHHALIAASRTIDQEEGVVGAPGLSRELLRLFDRFGRLEQIVDARHRREVDRADIVADELAKS
jgi:hypothetical protein